MFYGASISILSAYKKTQIYTPEEEKEEQAFIDHKRAVYHGVIKHLLETLVYASYIGETMTCGDGVVRTMYPGVCMLSMDYEEQ